MKRLGYQKCVVRRKLASSGTVLSSEKCHFSQTSRPHFQIIVFQFQVNILPISQLSIIKTSSLSSHSNLLLLLYFKKSFFILNDLKLHQHTYSFLSHLFDTTKHNIFLVSPCSNSSCILPLLTYFTDTALGLSILRFLKVFHSLYNYF